MLLDDLSVPDLPEHWLNQRVAMVLQDTFLFSGTLADDLRYGRPDTTDFEVAAVAEAALVTEFAARRAGRRTRRARRGARRTGS